MGVKVFVASISPNVEIKKQIQRVLMILDSMHIEYQPVDITEPGKEEEKRFMKSHSKAKSGNNMPLPPQIFNDEEYCGDYEDFDNANEMNELKPFLKLQSGDETDIKEKEVSSGVVKVEENGVHSDQEANGVIAGDVEEGEKEDPLDESMEEVQASTLDTSNPREEDEGEEKEEGEEEDPSDVIQDSHNDENEEGEEKEEGKGEEDEESPSGEIEREEGEMSAEEEGGEEKEEESSQHNEEEEEDSKVEKEEGVQEEEEIDVDEPEEEVEDVDEPEIEDEEEEDKE